MECLKKGFVVWLTGLPGSGKTTLSFKISEMLKNEGYRVEVIDGDWFRKNIDPNAGYTKEERRNHLLRVATIARLLARNGIITICSFVSPYEDVRNEVKKLIEEEVRFYLIYTKCNINECIKRDPKGLYKKALRGEIKNFTGISDPYEEPIKADLTLDTANNSIENNSKILYDFIKKSLLQVSKSL
ncbi:MAG: adenylyl-sulfate kinase [Caldisphaera sp.]|jgi:adenylylsulfate kinase|nr:adenylyl-sulfate kinase [Caldisphaera sp.]PMP60508.1 MAG: adenylyl-sulfate kinase [Caldisphaera sp.]PMP90523.1 MAG: adenylyl-sulfate kinase [Caldisphaera sp.]